LAGIFIEIATSEGYKKRKVDESHKELKAETTEHEPCSDGFCICRRIVAINETFN